MSFSAYRMQMFVRTNASIGESVVRRMAHGETAIDWMRWKKETETPITRFLLEEIEELGR